ncbi:MAG: hypothetical protein A2987_01640 [Omnitrophica bacterium RIFCSPLOWO2_01_FULL_45_10]|nr:MAG: hypothetical protein A2987_01640 [Omnitrophica bacterium RIFCSPLOWO2_01_FULL_45_10]
MGRLSCAPVLFFMSMLLLAGCGYTTRSLLAPEHKSIYVEKFANKIQIAEETSDARMYRGYRPGLEVDITKAVIDRFLSDGNLKIASQEGADLILKGELVDFKKDALRYDANDNVEEYRIKLVVNLELMSDKGVIWEETNFAGDATYRTTGALVKSESDAIKDATQDLARRVVERTIEGW